MSNIKPLLKLSFKSPNSRIALATKSLISVMADRERVSVNSKQASESSEYWQRAEVISKVATTDVELALSLFNTLEKSASTQRFDIFDLKGFDLNTIKKLARIQSVQDRLDLEDRKDNLQTSVLNPRLQLKARAKALTLLNNLIKKDPSSDSERNRLTKEWNDSLEETVVLEYQNPKTKKKVQKQVKVKATRNYPKQRVAPLKRAMKKVYDERFFEFAQKIVELSEVAVQNYIEAQRALNAAKNQQQEQKREQATEARRQQISKNPGASLSRRDFYALYDSEDQPKTTWTQDEYQGFLDQNWETDKSLKRNISSNMESEFYKDNFPRNSYTDRELEMLSGDDLRSALAKSVKKYEKQYKKDMKGIANTPKNRKNMLAEYLYEEYMGVKVYADALDSFKSRIETLAQERD